MSSLNNNFLDDKNLFSGETALKTCLQYKELEDKRITFKYQDKILQLIADGAAGPSPILWAWRQSELNLADYLIDHQTCYLDRCDERGLSPLLYAANKGDLKLVKRLHASGADLEPMTKAISGTLSLPHSLTDEQIGFLVDNYHTVCNRKGVSPLLPAFQNKGYPIVPELLNLKVNPKLTTEAGLRPLSHAVRTRQMTVIEALLSHQSPPLTALDLENALDEAKGHQNLTLILKGYLRRAQINS
ncbi:hypothetical protein N7471_010366 [Penicillium samsonianum]|uniref:uncharacterized protein n=1 Tax=Penicillium samsonianum TaxID=1882272 RepID=UPI002548C34F|nr:uncharacterized protein N7471_010366 [Penicillium samsonianum]KAJ6125873.1 hypothetical protein N7471_010366 [Penicillium samsonianum]